MTEKQKALFPEMLGGYLQRTQAKGIAVIVGAMNDATAHDVYEICEKDFQTLLREQMAQLEEAKGE